MTLHRKIESMIRATILELNHFCLQRMQAYMMRLVNGAHENMITSFSPELSTQYIHSDAKIDIGIIVFNEALFS